MFFSLFKYKSERMPQQGAVTPQFMNGIPGIPACLLGLVFSVPTLWDVQSTGIGLLERRDLNFAKAKPTTWLALILQVESLCSKKKQTQPWCLEVRCCLPTVRSTIELWGDALCHFLASRPAALCKAAARVHTTGRQV